MKLIILKRADQLVGFFLDVSQANIIHSETDSNLICLILLKSMRDFVYFLWNSNIPDPYDGTRFNILVYMQFFVLFQIFLNENFNMTEKR
jgi:hypothetical protein